MRAAIAPATVVVAEAVAATAFAQRVDTGAQRVGLALLPTLAAVVALALTLLSLPLALTLALTTKLRVAAAFLTTTAASTVVVIAALATVAGPVLAIVAGRLAVVGVIPLRRNTRLALRARAFG